MPFSEPSMSQDAAYWQQKHEHLAQMYEKVQKRNEELEERMLNVVEKVEHDKVTLSEEIDELAARLLNATNKVFVLENDCARYKKDCMLAVHLLQCTPSNYVATSLPSHNPEYMEKPPDASPSRMIPAAMPTFPPTGIYLDDEQPDDPSPADDIDRLKDQIAHGTLPSRGSFTRDFVEKIRSDLEYSVTSLRQCDNCGTSVTMLSQSVQTDDEDKEAPMPIFLSEQRLRSMSDASDVTVV